MGQTNLAGRVVKVTKAWYGLKESNRIFSEDLKTTLASIDYAPTIMDSQVYLPTSRRHGDSAILMHALTMAHSVTHTMSRQNASSTSCVTDMDRTYR